MPDLSIFNTPAPYHIITYGTLLGTQFFQSFINGIVAYKSLPRPQFSTFQTNLFPIYFGIQTALPALLALTYPGALGSPSSLAGALSESNRYAVLVPIATVFVSGLVNLVWIGPETTRVMKERKHQETKDGKKSYDAAPHSKEMERLNSSFGRLHGTSTLINLAGFVATLWYGFSLAERITPLR